MQKKKRLRRGLRNVTKTHLKEIGCEGLEWNELAQVIFQWLTFFNKHFHSQK
jgi:hypothetical protein